MLKIYQFNVRFAKQKLEIYFRKRNVNMSCSRFLEYVIYKMQAKNDNLLLEHEKPSDYGLFEYINGIEQMISEHQNIFEINNFVEHHIAEVTSEQVVVLSSTFIIRKKNKVEQAPIKTLSMKALCKIKSFYKQRLTERAGLDTSSSGFGSSCHSRMPYQAFGKGQLKKNRDVTFDIRIRQRKGLDSVSRIKKTKYLTLTIKIDKNLC